LGVTSVTLQRPRASAGLAVVGVHGEVAPHDVFTLPEGIVHSVVDLKPRAAVGLLPRVDPIAGSATRCPRAFLESAARHLAGR